MKYQNIVKAKFIERKNRFVATVEIIDDNRSLTEKKRSGEVATVHVKNTGRCKELLVPGATVYLEDYDGRMGTRKLRYSLIAVEKQRDSGENGDSIGDVFLINMDSQAPNKVVYEALKSGKLVLPGWKQRGGCEKGVPAYSLIRPEATHGNSRFDFYVESGASGQKAFIEVKGVTLESEGFARFPDAPTERGVKHIEELCRAAEEGYRAYLIFVIQMKKIHTFGPNYETHPEFGRALTKASEKGVQILAYDCQVTEDSLMLDQPVEVDLTEPTKQQV